MKAIRRILPLAALLPLGGCVLAIGNTPEEGGPVGKRLSAIEKRLDALEKGNACFMPGGAMPAGAFTIQGGECGDMKVMGGKVIFIGPDGKKTEMNLGEGDMKVETEGTEIEEEKPAK